MNTNNLISQCFHLFKKLPTYQTISFAYLVEETIGKDCLKQLEVQGKKMFELHKAFLRKVKEEGIAIKQEDYQNAPVGIPYYLGFYKTEPSKEIRTITLNYAFSDYGLLEELSRDYVVFSSKKIRYVRKPLGNPSKTNPLINITIDPNEKHQTFCDCSLEEINYTFDFNNICLLTKS